MKRGRGGKGSREREGEEVRSYLCSTRTATLTTRCSMTSGCRAPLNFGESSSNDWGIPHSSSKPWGYADMADVFEGNAERSCTMNQRDDEFPLSGMSTRIEHKQCEKTCNMGLADTVGEPLASKGPRQAKRPRDSINGDDDERSTTPGSTLIPSAESTPPSCQSEDSLGFGSHGLSQDRFLILSAGVPAALSLIHI